MIGEQQPNPEMMARANQHVVAAGIFKDAKAEEYKARVLSGTQVEIEASFIAAVAAYEAWLEAMRTQMRFMKMSWGLDPDAPAGL